MVAIGQVQCKLVNLTLNAGSTMQLNIYEAKSQFSNLVDRAVAGETIVIARAGKPLVRLMPVAVASTSRSGVKFGGALAGKIQMSPDFSTPMTDADLLGHP